MAQDRELLRTVNVRKTPMRTSPLSEIEHPTVGKVLWMGIGAALAISLTDAGSALAQPALTDVDLAYCAAHPDIVADMWRERRTDLAFDLRSEVANIAGYFRHNRLATVALGAKTCPDDNWGEQAPTDGVDDQLPAARRALTHP